MKSVIQLEQNIRSHKRAVLLVNTRSRKGRLLFGEAKRRLEAAGFELTASFAIRKPRYIGDTIDQALALNPELLVVGSGDGTVSRVIDHLAYKDIVLGYLPLGTTNNLGRSLQIPTELSDAIDVIVNGKVAAVDLGVVNGDYFGNMSSMGVSAGIAAGVPAKLKRYFGRLAYPLYAVKVFMGHRPFRVTVRSEAGTHHYYTHQFCIANGSMHAGRPIAADAHVDNGMLVAYALGGRSRLSTIIATLRHSRSTDVRMRHKGLLMSKCFEVAVEPRQKLEVDGEVRMIPESGAVRFEVAADALRVLVPQSFRDE